MRGRVPAHDAQDHSHEAVIAVAPPGPVRLAVQERVPGEEVRTRGRETDAAQQGSVVRSPQRDRVPPLDPWLRRRGMRGPVPERQREQGDQAPQHHPSTRGKPPNWVEMRAAPTIFRGLVRTKTHWLAVGQVTSSHRPSGDRTTCPKTPVPRKTTWPWLTTSLCPTRRRMTGPSWRDTTRRSTDPVIASYAIVRCPFE